MSYPPANIREMVAANDRHQAMAREQATAVRTAIIAKWSDQNLRKAGGATGTLGGTLGGGGGALTLRGTTSDRDAGIRNGAETVKAARQARLRELFEREAQMYELELNAMGLSLAKPRD